MTIEKAEILERFRKGDVRALSRLISAAENQEPIVSEILEDLFPSIGFSQVIGITGPPGAGKSSLTNLMVRYLREQQKTVAVVAVDPVSPFTGGALLGDRIRLLEHFNDEKVFIRSLSTRGKLGGLSLATRQVVHLLDAFKTDFIIIETVGVGQSEVDIRLLADQTLVVLVPEWGDAVQTLKAGLLEIGDVFTVNKSDREGADRLVQELKQMVHLSNKDYVPVLSSSIQDESSTRELFHQITKQFIDRKRQIEERRKQRISENLYELMEEVVLRESRDWVKANRAQATNPYQFIRQFIAKHPTGILPIA